MRLDIVHDLDAPCELVAPWIEDLGRYPAWMPLVSHADREPGAGAPAWAVELTGRIGPLARSKRLRMVRTVHEPGRIVRFERAEQDGRTHSPWTLEAVLRPTPNGSRVEVHLAYGGGLFGPVLERLLGEQVGEARTRLSAVVSAGPPPGAAGPR
jgi:hypothetical protein